MVNDGDCAGISVAKHQIGNTDEAVAANTNFKAILHGENLILIPESIKGFEVFQSFIIILTSKAMGKGRKVVTDGFTIPGCVNIGKFKAHQLPLGPSFQDAVTVGTVFSISVLFQRQLVDILELERLRTLVVKLQFAEGPFHIGGNSTHNYSPVQNGCDISDMRTANSGRLSARREGGVIPALFHEK